MTWEMDQKIMEKRFIQEGERKKALEVAKSLLKEGMAVEKIAKITKLPVEEVAALA